MSNQPLSPETLVKQGSCCGCGCQNCPYLDEQGQRNVAGTTSLNKAFIKFLKKNPQKQWLDFLAFAKKKTQKNKL